MEDGTSTITLAFIANYALTNSRDHSLAVTLDVESPIGALLLVPFFGATALQSRHCAVCHVHVDNLPDTRAM